MTTKAWELTPTQSKILQQVALGFTAAEVAAALCRSEKTIESHLRDVRKFLKARNTTHAVAIALRTELI